METTKIIGTKDSKQSKAERRAELRAANGQSAVPPATPPADAPPVKVVQEPTAMQRLATLSLKIAGGNATIGEINELLKLTAEINKQATTAATSLADQLATEIREALMVVSDDVLAAWFSAFSGRFVAASPAVAEVKDGDKVVTPAQDAKPARIEFSFSTGNGQHKSPGSNGSIKRATGDGGIKQLTEIEKNVYLLRSSGKTFPAIAKELGKLSSTCQSQYASASIKIEKGAEDPTAE